MGSYVELNDTLQITEEQGFPSALLDLEKHRESPIKLEDIPPERREFRFHGKPNPRVYQVPDTRNFLVHNIGGKWLYWGHVLITELTRKGETQDDQIVSGVARIIKIYDPEYQVQITNNESPEGLSYFD